MNIKKLRLHRGNLRTLLVVFAILFMSYNAGIFSAGAGVFFAGLVIHFISKGFLRRTTELALRGPYSFVRHPFYVANLLLDCGIIIMSGHPIFILVYLPLYYKSYHRVILEEEDELVRIHGRRYEDYIRKVPRYFPRLKPYAKDWFRGLKWKNILREREFSRFLRLASYPLALLVIHELVKYKWQQERAGLVLLGAVFIITLLSSSYVLHNMVERNRISRDSIVKVIMKRRMFVLILLSVLLLFFQLGKRPLLSSGEVRASEIALEMVFRGNILVPYLNERIVLTKPPLFHWLIIIANMIFGKSEFASRFFAVGSGVITCLVVYLFGRRFWGDRKGFRAGIILLLSPEFFWNARCARIDALNLLLFTMGLFFFWIGYMERKRVFIYLWFLSIGLGFVAKGHVSLIGLVVPLVFLVWVKNKDFLKEIPWVRCTILFSVIAFPWYIYIYFNVPEQYTSWFFVGQNVQWFKGMNLYKSLSYIPNFFLGMFPWSILAIPALAAAWKNFKQRDEKAVFLYVWVILAMLLFCFLGKKVVRYILPVYPAVALFVGWHWNDIVNRRKWINTVIGIYAVLGVFFVLALMIYPAYSAYIEPSLGRLVERYIISNRYILTICIIAALGILFGSLKRRWPHFFAIGLVQMLFVAAFVLVVVPVEKDYYSPKPFCSAMEKLVPEEEKVYAFNSWENSIRYYFGRHVDILQNEKELKRILEEEKRPFIIMWEKVYNVLPDNMKDRVEIVLKGYKVMRYKALLVAGRCPSKRSG